MHTKITIHAAPERLFAWLAEPKNARHWFAQLRHEADGMPDPRMSADLARHRIHWSTEPAGEMVVTGRGEVSDLILTFRDGDHAPQPPREDESPDDGPTNAASALRSIKSHVEAADGGDPDMHTPGVVSREDVEEAEREIAEDPDSGGTPWRKE